MRDNERIRKAGRFREAAESALEAGHLEAAVACAYYACFHACAALLFNQGIIRHRTPRPTHEMVKSSIARLARDPSLRQIRLPGDDAFPRSYNKVYNLRKDAHYTAVPIDKRTVRQVVRFAGQVVDFANERIP